MLGIPVCLLDVTQCFGLFIRRFVGSAFRFVWSACRRVDWFLYPALLTVCLLGVPVCFLGVLSVYTVFQVIYSAVPLLVKLPIRQEHMCECWLLSYNPFFEKGNLAAFNHQRIGYTIATCAVAFTCSAAPGFGIYSQICTWVKFIRSLIPVLS